MYTYMHTYIYRYRISGARGSGGVQEVGSECGVQEEKNQRRAVFVVVDEHGQPVSPVRVVQDAVPGGFSKGYIYINVMYIYIYIYT